MYLTKSKVELIQDLVGSTSVHKVLPLHLYFLSFGRKRHRGRNFNDRLACTAGSNEEGTSLAIFAISLLPSVFGREDCIFAHEVVFIYFKVVFIYFTLNLNWYRSQGVKLIHDCIWNHQCL